MVRDDVWSKGIIQLGLVTQSSISGDHCRIQCDVRSMLSHKSPEGCFPCSGVTQFVLLGGMGGRDPKTVDTSLVLLHNWFIVVLSSLLSHNRRNPETNPNIVRRLLDHWKDSRKSFVVNV